MMMRIGIASSNGQNCESLSKSGPNSTYPLSSLYPPTKGQPGLVRFPNPPYGLSSQSGNLTKPGPTNDNEKDDADDAGDDKE